MSYKFTKIVATVGPSSSNPEVLKNLIREGADVIRLNFSHGTFEDHLKSVQLVRSAAKEADKPIAIFQDLQGPKIRVGKLDADFITINTGEEFVLTTDDITGGVINGMKKVSIDHKTLHEEAKAGDRILLDDGLFELRVEKIIGTDIYTRVINGGNLKPRKGVNFPHIKLKLSAITEKDRSDLRFAFDNDLDFVALSFVRNAADIHELIELMMEKYGRKIPIIAKVEKPEAFLDIDNIIEAADVIMVARGDLGVETSPQEVPVMQKTIIRKCNLAGKLVITATQMLESMIGNPRPTRAEANDVANAIFDGTDAVMLSGETASGKYPVEAVRMMKDIAMEVESSDVFQREVFHKNISQEEVQEMTNLVPEEAVSFAAIELAHKIGAKFLVSFTHSGSTARKASKYRPNMPIVAFSPVQPTVRRLALAWGIIPIELGKVITVDALLDGAAEVLKFKKMVEANDFIVVTAGVPVGVAGSTNLIKVVKI